MQKIKFGGYTTSAVFGVSAAIAMYSVTVPVHGYVPYTQLLPPMQCDRGLTVAVGKL